MNRATTTLLAVSLSLGVLGCGPKKEPSASGELQDRTAQRTSDFFKNVEASGYYEEDERRFEEQVQKWREAGMLPPNPPSLEKPQEPSVAEIYDNVQQIGHGTGDYDALEDKYKKINTQEGATDEFTLFDAKYRPHRGDMVVFYVKRDVAITGIGSGKGKGLMFMKADNYTMGTDDILRFSGTSTGTYPFTFSKTNLILMSRETEGTIRTKIDRIVQIEGVEGASGFESEIFGTFTKKVQPTEQPKEQHGPNKNEADGAEGQLTPAEIHARALPVTFGTSAYEALMDEYKQTCNKEGPTKNFMLDNVQYDGEGNSKEITVIYADDSVYAADESSNRRIKKHDTYQVDENGVFRYTGSKIGVSDALFVVQNLDGPMPQKDVERFINRIIKTNDTGATRFESDIFGNFAKE